jgi:hypothetical protein
MIVIIIAIIVILIFLVSAGYAYANSSPFLGTWMIPYPTFDVNFKAGNTITITNGATSGTFAAIHNGSFANNMSSNQAGILTANADGSLGTVGISGSIWPYTLIMANGILTLTPNYGGTIGNGAPIVLTAAPAPVVSPFTAYLGTWKWASSPATSRSAAYSSGCVITIAGTAAAPIITYNGQTNNGNMLVNWQSPSVTVAPNGALLPSNAGANKYDDWFYLVAMPGSVMQMMMQNGIMGGIPLIKQ